MTTLLQITLCSTLVCAIAALIVVVMAKLLHKALASSDKENADKDTELLLEINAKVTGLEKRLEKLESEAVTSRNA